MAKQIERSERVEDTTSSAELEEGILTVPGIGVDERIRFRAYELYLSRGEEHGRDLDDWLLAEQEIVGD